MSILGSLLTAGVSGVSGGIVEALGRTFDKLFTSDEERASAEYLMAKLAAQPHLLQAEINKIEAAHTSIFVAGWRPFIGWVCGLGLAFAFLVAPTLAYFGIPSPAIPLDVMYNMVLALLGLGGLRTLEKVKGVERKTMGGH